MLPDLCFGLFAQGFKEWFPGRLDQETVIGELGSYGISEATSLIRDGRHVWNISRSYHGEVKLAQKGRV